MSILKVALLGPPEVEHFGRRLTFPDRKALALLAYFAAEGGMHERRRLSQLLWPESDAAHGRTALRIALYHLRHTLEEGAGPGHASHLLILHETLGLDLSSDIELDLQTLREAWGLARNRAAREEAQGELRHTMIDRLQHAVALYRGSFLEDFTLRDTVDFDNWMGIQRNSWYQRIEQIFDWLSQMQSAEGAFEQAIATIERWRSLDPLNEDVSLRLMQLQLARGNRVAALKTYESTVEVLREELSTKPSSKLVALAEFIRNTPAQRSGLARKQRVPRSSSSRSLLVVPFVGRGAEMGLLVSLYEKASRGQPQVVVIEGETGIGKSRLAATFLDWARAQGADVLAGRAFHSHQHLAYQPLVEPLRERLAREPDLRLLLSDTWLAELSRLLPDLRERYPDLPPASVGEAFEASRFLEALARLDQALAGRATLLVFIDDLQWTDKATLDVFQYLGMQWAKRSTPVIVLLNRRVETRSADPWLNEWFARLKSDLPVTRLELGPLSAKDTLQIALSVSGKDVPQDDDLSERSTFPSTQRPERAPTSETGSERLGAWLYAETKGQPFFMRTTLEAMLRRGVLVPRLVKGRGWVFEPQEAVLHPEVLGSILPSDVREAIQRRLAQLSPSARELLAAGAVLDHDFTFEVLSQVAQLSEQEALTAMDEALESLLLQESQRYSDGGESPTYTFAHDKIREVVYAGAGDARRRIFHRRALDVLEQAGASAAELAYHALASGSAQLAFRWSVAAGNEAMAVFAARDAIGHYEQARRLAEQRKIDVPMVSLLQLFGQLGQAYEIRNDASAAQATYQAMLDTARRVQNVEMECVALNRQAVLEGENLSRTEHAQALLHEALEVAGLHHDRQGLAETYWSLARVNYYALRLEESLVYGRQAYALVSELGKPDLLLRVLNVLSYTTKALGQWEEFASLAEEAWRLATQQGNRIMEADCLARVADARINFGQPGEGVTAARAAYAISLEIEHAWSQALSGYTLARGLAETGAYEEALTIALSSTSAANTLTFSVLQIVNLLALGIVYQALLLFEKARGTYLEAMKISESVSAKRYIAMSASLLCADAVLREDWQGAASYARQAQAARDPHEVIFAETPRWPETVALLRAGEDKQAAEDLEHFREHFGTNKRCSIVLARAQALLAQSRGENQKAVAYVQFAITEAKAIGLPGEEWQAEVALARLYPTCNEYEQSLTRAASTIEQLAGNITNDDIRVSFLAQAHALLSAVRQ